MIKVYLAAPFGEPQSEKRNNAAYVAALMRIKDYEVFCPWEHIIPHGWDYPNTEWGLMVFTNDIEAIQQADLVVVLSYGRHSTAGTNWEAGYAFGIGKRVVVVEMTDEIMSLMVANGRYATVKGIAGLEEYLKDPKPYRTDTEQK